MEKSDHYSDQFQTGGEHNGIGALEGSILNHNKEQEGRGDREGREESGENRGERIGDELRLDERNGGEVTETEETQETIEISTGDVDAKEVLLTGYPSCLTDDDQQDTVSD